jgi:biopolymer transport protein ExbD/biopolymer transport protein TolR
MGMNVGGAGPRADINITPLIDVLLVLIIIFLVCHNRSLGLDAVIPQPGPQRAEPPARTIVVQVIDVAKSAGVEKAGLMKAETPAGNLSQR